MKIIVVDDSKLMRQRIIGLISDIPGVDISAEAASSIEAIELLEKLKPDVIILDIRMPEGNGLKVLKYIQQKESSVITIVFTNYPLKQYKDKCMELGADYFFDKSNEFEKLLEVVQKLSIHKGIQDKM